MRRLNKILLGSAMGYATYVAVNNRQQLENIKGAYLSIISSCRSAWIVYTSYQDYQNSLNELPYNSPEYHAVRHEVHLRVANRILELSK